MEVDKYWSELLMTMTESDGSRVRISEENELLALNTNDFFIKLVVFKERLNKKLDQSKSTKK